jgi:hypothetical protein
MGGGRSSSASATLNTATLAPVPSAIDATAMAVSDGFRRTRAVPYLKSCQSRSTMDEDIGVARALANAGAAAESPQRVAAGVGLGHPGGDVRLNRLVDVELQLLVDLGVEIAAPDDVGQAMEPAHG